jgi:hypothetical protein
MKKVIFPMLFLFLVILSSCQKESKETTTVNEQTTQRSIQANTLQFAGYTWNITNSGGVTQGPGPNIFDPSYAWVDTDGFLHLKLAKSTVDNKYHCAEVTLAQNLGYGTYQWNVEGALGSLDKNVVFGMFNYSGNDGFDEMDIEYSKWGVQNNNNMLNYTLYPQTGSTQSSVEVVYPFTLTGTYTTQRFKRTSNSVTFKSLGGFYNDDTNLYASQTWTNPPNSVSTLAMPVLMNLWLYGGKKPATGYSVEIIIHNFTYTPL